jgi:uncharacterized protein YndB with AHSA1/START domain
MSLKKDNGHRAVAMEIELSGTPEQVWQAIATGPGFSAWFTPTEIEEREGGAVAFHLGEGMTSRGNVTAWQPPKLLAFEERDWSGEAPPLATEITVEAQAGGTCKVRMVHSLFTDKDDWDNELASMENGWPPFFVVLRIYLRSFAGQRAASAGIKGGFAGTQDAAWDAVQQALGLTGANVGDTRDTSANGGPRAVGEIIDRSARAHQRSVTMRLAEPPGVAIIGTYEWGGNVGVSVSLYFYGTQADALAAREKSAWERWMQQHFKPQEAAG